MRQNCPCTSGKAYEDCCQPYHLGKKRPLPLPLMRSRFAAYALGKVGYVVKTEHPDNPRRQNERQFRQEIKRFCQTTQFVGLQILDSELGDETATVTFQATLLQSGQDASFTERSLFEKKNGRWFYTRPLTNPG